MHRACATWRLPAELERIGARAQSARFRLRLVADALTVFPALTALICGHGNKDVRHAAQDAFSAALREVLAACISLHTGFICRRITYQRGMMTGAGCVSL